MAIEINSSVATVLVYIIFITGFIVVFLSTCFVAFTILDRLTKRICDFYGATKMIIEWVKYKNQFKEYLAKKDKINTDQYRWRKKIFKLLTRAMEDTRGLDAKYSIEESDKLSDALNSIADHTMEEIIDASTT